MWAFAVIFALVVGFSTAHQRSDHRRLEHENRVLKTKIVRLKKNQMHFVRKIDGVEITNLDKK